MHTRKKRRRRNIEEDFVPALRYEDAGIHVPALMVGMVSSLLLVFLSLNYLSDPVKAKRKLENAGSSEPTKAVTELDSDDFESVLKHGQEADLKKLLLKLNNWDRAATLPIQVESNRRRVSVANQMLQMALTEKGRRLAIRSKIDALSVIYGLDTMYNLREPNVAETLHSASARYLKDENREIARAARLAMLKYSAFEAIKDKANFSTKDNSAPKDIQVLVDQMVALLKDFPDDEELIATIKLVPRYYNEVDSSTGTSFGPVLIREIVARVDDISDSPVAIELIGELSEMNRLKQSGFLDLFEDRWLNGSVGEARMIEKSLELLNDPSSGKLILTNVDLVTRWFEQENKYESAQQLYDAMLAASDQYSDQAVCSIGKQLAEDGLRRLQLLNQPLLISGTQPDGSQVDPGKFENRVVVVVFWSRDNDQSVRDLMQLYRETVGLRNRGGELVAISVLPEWTKRDKSLVESLSDICFLYSPTGRPDQQPLIQRFPGPQLPHAILIDRAGKVVDINIPLGEVRSEAGFLLSEGD